MSKINIPMIIFAAVCFIYAVPVLLNPAGSNPFALACAGFAALAGICLVAGLIIRAVREDRENKKTDQTNRKGGSDEDM
jgi:hypothetical protein